MNSCFVSFTFLCFKSDMFLSDSSASLYLFCFGESIRSLKIAGVLRFMFYVLRFTFYVLRFTFYVLRFTFVSLVGHLWYFMGISCKVECFRGNATGPA